MEITNATDVTIHATSGTDDSTPFGDGNFMHNLSHPPVPETMVHDPWLAYFIVTLACVFLLVGLLGNGLTLVVTLKSDTRSKSQNILIMSLAVADTLSLLTNTFYIRAFGEISFIDMTALKSVNNFTCKLLNATYRTSIFNSSLMIMLICIERFILVWFPLKSRNFLTKRLTILSVAVCIATILVFVAIPSVLYGGIRNGICYHDFDVNGDGESDTIQSTPLLSIIVVLFVIFPILIILSLTPMTIIKLYRQQATRRGLTTQELRTGPYRTSVLLTAVVVVYLTLAGIPYLVFAAISASGTDVVGSNAIAGSWVFSIILQANYSTNFVLYTMFNAEFKQNLFNMLGISNSCCRCQNRVRPA